MASIDLDLELSDEERQLQETVHKFAAEVMRPAGIALDKLADPEEVIAEGSILWDVFEKHKALGLEALEDPASGFTPGQQARRRSIISEEFGWGDSGLAISFGVNGFPRTLALLSGKPHLIERYARPGLLGCWAITEPDHGSDTLACSEPHFVDPAVKANCIATKRRRRIRDPRPEGGLGFERHHRHSRNTLLHHRSETRDSRAAGSPSCRWICRACRVVSRSTKSASGRSTRAKSTSTMSSSLRTIWSCRRNCIPRAATPR